MRTERRIKSNFPIKCIYNSNILNRKTVKYSQRHTVYIEKNNLSCILTTILVSFNENEFKLQKTADRSNSAFNEEQLIFIARKLCDGEQVSAIRRSYETEYHRNTPLKALWKTAFFSVANRLKTCGNFHSKHPSGRLGYSNEATERVAFFS